MPPLLHLSILAVVLGLGFVVRWFFIYPISEAAMILGLGIRWWVEKLRKRKEDNNGY